MVNPLSRRWPRALLTCGRRRLGGAAGRRPFARVCAFLGVSFGLVLAAFGAEINPPLGPHVNLTPADFEGVPSYTLMDRVVLTPYFYWYDVYTSAHIVNGDGSDALTDHPPSLTGFSYRSRSWHRQQLEDMLDAGIDVALPVYWGEPSQRIPNRPVEAQPWSYAGLPPLVQAREDLLAAGRAPPSIGMFYDTSTLEYNTANERIDLTTPRGRQWFYESVRDFFSLVPPRHWALIEGKPVVFLYSAAFAARHDQSCIDYLRSSFARDFGGRTPFVVREISWRVESENVYAWGGALGLKNPGVASLGPGYDHSAVPGRTPLVVPREGGAFFERNWIRFLRNPSTLVMIETWNEYHEGTEIAPTREYGRAYLDLNREYVQMFKQGIRPPRPRGPYSEARAVSVTLGEENQARGLEQFDHADGVTRPARLGDRPGRAIVPTEYGGRYIYCRIDDSFKWAERMLVDVAVEYYDSRAGQFRVEFDGSDPQAPFNGAYTASKLTVNLAGSESWKTATFRLVDARFLNSQNGGADFRLAVTGNEFHVGKITVTRLGVPEEAGQRLEGVQPDLSQPLAEAWLAVNADPDTYRSTGGLIEVRATPSHPSFLLLQLPTSAVGDAELLARVRVVSYRGLNRSLGGVALGVNAPGGSGLQFAFAVDGLGKPQLWLGDARLPPGPQVAYAWTTNTWYWLRLRHRTNALTGYPDLLGRIWSADGETAEPSAWLAWWDYYPSNPARVGLPGIVPGRGEAGAAIECDYFLVCAESLPEVVARLPAWTPARFLLAALSYSSDAGFRLRLSGAPERRYAIESSADFNDWVGAAITTGPAGLAEYDDRQASARARRFFRARHAD